MASAGIVHGVWDHRRIMKIPAHIALPGLSPFPGYVSVLPVVLRTNDNSPWTNEFDSKSDPSQNPLAIHMRNKKASCVLAGDMVTLYLRPAEIELSCLIESISTIKPRIEWKKITNEGPSYVYFERKISGNTPNTDVLLYRYDTLHSYHFFFLQVTWRTEL